MDKSLKLKDIKREDIEREKLFKILKNESLRGKIIVGVAFLESHLKNLLKKRFVDNKNLSGFIENIKFYHLIYLAYFVGCISEEEKDDILLLNEIRNKFAHNWDLDLSDDNEIKEKIYKLQVIKLTGATKTQIAADYDFIINSAVVLMDIILTRREDECEKIPQCKSYYPQ